MGKQDNGEDTDNKSKGTFNDRIDLLIKTLLAAAIAIGCYFVVEPFLTSVSYTHLTLPTKRIV